MISLVWEEKGIESLVSLPTCLDMPAHVVRASWRSYCQDIYVQYCWQSFRDKGTAVRTSSFEFRE